MRPRSSTSLHPVRCRARPSGNEAGTCDLVPELPGLLATIQDGMEAAALLTKGKAALVDQTVSVAVESNWRSGSSRSATIQPTT